MKFSMIFEAQLADPTPERERQVLRDCVEQAIYAEASYAETEEAADHVAALVKDREELVAKLHEANIPARPAGGVHGDHPPVGREGHPALQGAGGVT